MSIIDQAWFSGIRQPSRYLGNEINAVRKDPSTTEVSVVLAFPDLYEVGMSHLGLKILYQILNSRDWIAAERVYAPWVDLEEELRYRGIPLTSLESSKPLSHFDILGFSLQQELAFTNVLTMLDLSGIPFLSSDREQVLPLIIAGGPACFNPEPTAEIFDAVLVGDGEEATIALCEAVRKAKRDKIQTKREILSEIAKIKGIYVPAFFKVHYQDGGTISRVEPLLREYHGVDKAVFPDINRHLFPSRQVVPFTSLIHDRLAVEIARGCTRGCRFCQAGMIYRPVRERNPDAVIQSVEEALPFTGFEEISLLSLSSGDYGCLNPLLKTLMDIHAGEKTAVSLPSLRVDSMDPQWFEELKRVRKTGFTLAPEAGTDRLRRVINKSLTNLDIIKIAGEVYRAGWNLIKLYFMIGLPGEERKDIQGIVDLAKEISSLKKGGGKKPKLNIGLTTFVPKAHTPFMWQPQITIEQSHERIGFIQDALKGTRTRVKWNAPEMSWLEGIFSRGDRRLIRALLEAWRLGARFDAWSEHFNMDIWEEAFQVSRLDPNFYLHRTRSMEEVLPWDHIRSGVEKDYLKSEWEKTLRDEMTPDCREKCLGCGVCDHKKIDPVLFKEWRPPSRQGLPSSERIPETANRYRMTFSKTGIARYLSHLELVRVFIRAIKRAGLNLAFSEGFHPLPKISFTTALPVGTESLQETAYVDLHETMSVSPLEEKINLQLPKGIKVTDLKKIARGEGKAVLKESHYQITMNGLEMDPLDLEAFLKADCFPVDKAVKGGTKRIDARPLVKSMELVSPSSLVMAIRHSAGPELKPAEIIKGIFRLDDAGLLGIKVLKTGQILR